MPRAAHEAEREHDQYAQPLYGAQKGATADARGMMPSPAATTHVSETIRDGDSFEVALKRFGRKVQQAGILSEAKRRRHYEPPSVKRKRKADARRRKELKRLAKIAARGF